MSTQAIAVAIGFRLEAPYRERLQQRFPHVNFRYSDSKAALMQIVADADIFFGWPNDAIVQAGKRLRWLHILGAGADGFSARQVQDRAIVVSNSRGVGAPNIAEHVLALMFGFARALPALARAQAQGHWTRSQDLRLFELSGQTLGIVGLGAIGQALALKAGALGMRVLGARRRAAAVHGVERVYPMGDLAELAAQADHLVACLPATPASAGLIGANVFQAMKPGSYFYNVGRGATVAAADLLHALENGPLAGAGLDVVDPEPLPPDHPFWRHPAVVLTSHTAGNTERYWERGIALFESNLDNYLAGRPLANLLDLDQGY
jgi:phosphoglycerate dehydrogenase-like enzyme